MNKLNLQSTLGVRIEEKTYKTFLIKSETSRTPQESGVKEFTKAKDFKTFVEDVVSNKDTKIVVLKSGKNTDELVKIFDALKNIPTRNYKLSEIIAKDKTAEELAEIDFTSRKLKRVKIVEKSVDEIKAELAEAEAKAEAKAKAEAEAKAEKPLSKMNKAELLEKASMLETPEAEYKDLTNAKLVEYITEKQS